MRARSWPVCCPGPFEAADGVEGRRCRREAGLAFFEGKADEREPRRPTALEPSPACHIPDTPFHLLPPPPNPHPADPADGKLPVEPRRAGKEEDDDERRRWPAPRLGPVRRRDSGRDRTNSSSRRRPGRAGVRRRRQDGRRRVRGPGQARRRCGREGGGCEGGRAARSGGACPDPPFPSARPSVASRAALLAVEPQLASAGWGVAQSPLPVVGVSRPWIAQPGVLTDLKLTFPHPPAPPAGRCARRVVNQPQGRPAVGQARRAQPRGRRPAGASGRRGRARRASPPLPTFTRSLAPGLPCALRARQAPTGTDPRARLLSLSPSQKASDWN